MPSICYSELYRFQTLILCMDNNDPVARNDDKEDDDKIKTEYLVLKRKFEELQSERENYKKQLLEFEAESRKWKKKASEVYSSKL